MAVTGGTTSVDQHGPIPPGNPEEHDTTEMMPDKDRYKRPPTPPPAPCRRRRNSPTSTDSEEMIPASDGTSRPASRPSFVEVMRRRGGRIESLWGKSHSCCKPCTACHHQHGRVHMHHGAPLATAQGPSQAHGCQYAAGTQRTAFTCGYEPMTADTRRVVFRGGGSY